MTNYLGTNFLSPWANYLALTTLFLALSLIGNSVGLLLGVSIPESDLELGGRVTRHNPFNYSGPQFFTPQKAYDSFY